MTSLDSAKKNKTKTAAEQKPAQFIYIGPNLPQYAIFTGRVYIGGIPKTADEALKKWPLMKQLFVTTDKINAAQIAMNTRGTPQNEAIRQMMKG